MGMYIGLLRPAPLYMFVVVFIVCVYGQENDMRQVYCPRIRAVIMAPVAVVRGIHGYMHRIVESTILCPFIHVCL